jgi:hypothetical protein
LHHAEGSPVAAVEDEKNAVAALVGQVEWLARLISEREIGSRLAGCGGNLRAGQAHFKENETRAEQC